MTTTNGKAHQTVIIIGHGMVAHHFIKSLLEQDTQRLWHILVLSEESDPAYDRVGLSSYVGTWERNKLWLEDNLYAAFDHAEVHLANPAAEINRQEHTVTTVNGQVFHYDALVLATGSSAFVPPVPGHDLAGCFVYRTLDDLDAIRALAEANPGATGVVVGGGLLGLEAANALRLMGLKPHVVEFAPRLMPVQVDAGGGYLLARLVTDLGLHVSTGVGTKAITAHETGLTVKLSDDSTVEAVMVIFAAGIRPRDELAKAAGLEVGTRGGVVTDIHCQTSDPHIYAIGEVAAIEGICYGLVAPGYSSAEVVVSALLTEQANSFPRADLSTKLKLLGVDVASFGDAHGTTKNSLDIVYTDAVKGTYAKLVLADDGQTLLGGVLVGNASVYALLKPMVGKVLEGDPATYITPTAEAMSAGALPDNAEICSCNAVNKGQIVEAIHAGATDVPAIKLCTRAGTTCGGCVPAIKQILTDIGVEVSRSICEHFPQSRPELFEIIRVTGIRSFYTLIREYGQGSGCEICKPAVASILASTSSDHILQPDQASLQDTNDFFLANLQKNGTYSVVPRMPGGEVTADQLLAIGQIAKDFNLYVKLTGGQRIDLFGARVEELPIIWERLIAAGMESGHAYGKSLRTVKSCVGSTWCRYGVQDSVDMAIRLEHRFKGLRSPHKLKFGVSGCARECAEARGKDIGIIATEHGWNLYIAGNGGQSPKHAVQFASGIDDETLIAYIDRILIFYIRTADRLQRTASWLEALEGGLEHLKEVVIDDSLGIVADLDIAMAAHIAGYQDEWSAVINDPAKRARFVSFINAPEKPDPTIIFDDSGLRKVPVLIGMPSRKTE